MAPGSAPRPPLGEIEIRFVRSSGPGGQNVNKVSTKAELRWPVARSRSLPAEVRERFLERFGGRISRDGVLVLRSQRYRDRGRNAAECVERLGRMLEEAARPPRPRRPTTPSRAARERRLAEKRRRSEVKRTRREPPEPP